MFGESMEKSTEHVTVFGVDILPGYSIESTSKQPHYALVILRDGEVIATYEDVSFSRLIRLSWEYRPDILAIDNVFELARNTDELIELIKILPPKTSIVQVTGWGSQQVSLENIAREMGLEVHGKLSPVKTAYLSAYIAYKGGGTVVKLLEEKTKIIVSRGRSVSHGGMSYDRFKRSVRAGILSVTKEIRKILDNNKLDYDLIFKRSKGGLEKSIFIVYAPRDKLYGLIKPFKNKSVRVTIKPVYKNKIVFEEKKVERRVRGLILGVDPGIYTGIALLDLKGRPLFVYSSKNLDRSEIISMASKYGEIVIVATDTHQPPEFVKKIAAALNARLYTPPNDLSTEEKQEIVNKLVSKYDYLDIKNTHVRDALAAAYKAYSWIKDKLESIESRLGSIDLDINTEKIKINVIRGRSFAEAFEEELDKYLETLRETSRVKQQVEVTPESLEEVIEKYKSRIEHLKNRVSYLETAVRELIKQLEEKDRVIEDLKLELKISARKDTQQGLEREKYVLKQELETLSRKLEEKDQLINSLYKRVKKLEDMLLKIVNGEYIAIPRVKNLCVNSVKKVGGKARYKLVYVDEIYPLDNDTINYLRENRIALITSRDYGELYRDVRIPIVKVDDNVLLDELAIVPKNVVEKVESMWSEIKRLDEEDQYKRVLKLIKEYKEARRKQFMKKTS